MGSSPSPVSSDSPAAASDPSCYTIYITGENMSEDTATMASISPFIVLGIFEGKGESFWSTKNGAPPASAREAQSTLLVTRVSLSVDTVIRGTPGQADHAVIYGGVVGCTAVVDDDSLSLKVGTRYLIFGTGPAEDAAGNLTNAFPIYEAWPVGADDVVETKIEGDLPLRDVTKLIAAHPVAPQVYPPGSTGGTPSGQPVPSADSGP